MHDGCCASRACFERLVIRTILPGGDRSIVGFGPDCSYIALHDCNLDGISGLLVPRTRVNPCSFSPGRSLHLQRTVLVSSCLRTLNEGPGDRRC